MAYVNINLRNSINSYNQRPKYESACAGICGCMAIKRHPDTLSYGEYLYPANWSKLANLAGKTSAEVYTTDLNFVLNVLKQGSPVIVRTRPESDPHWVIIYAYEGMDTVVLASNFRCIDPWNPNVSSALGLDCYLTSSNNYQNVQKVVYFY